MVWYSFDFLRDHMSSKIAKLGAVTTVVTLTCIVGFNIYNSMQQSHTIPLTIIPTAMAQPIITKNSTSNRIHDIKIKKGDTLAAIFQRLQLSKATLAAINTSPLAKSHLTKLKAGQTLTFKFTPQHALAQIIFPYDKNNTLYIHKTRHGYSTSLKSKPPTVALQYTTGTIKTTFKNAATHAGLNTALYNEFTQIFHNSIDFQHNVRHGDRFAVLYEEYYLDGKRQHTGHIMAAEFTNHGTPYRAFRYSYPKHHAGYYTLNGQSMSPLFLKAPVNCGRISSLFNYHRVDPFLHIVHPHLGIDYAAPKGTPIHSVGAGRVIFAGKENGFGNSVIIRYSSKYKALYGHMEKFAEGLHTGQYVQRGQVIGYIGRSGWATGPHLHFEMYVDNVPRDPLQLKVPGGQSIPTRYTRRYLNYSHRMLARFDLYQNSGFAENVSTKIIRE